MELFSKENVILMDGGFPMDLVDKADALPLWIDSYNVTNPEVVIQSHISYLKAGARLLKTNTYQSTVEGYITHMKMSQEEAKQKIKDGVMLCHEAIALYRKANPKVKEKIAVVGAIGTYGAHLHDGSDYTGAFADTLTKEDLKAFHREKIDVLVKTDVDALAFETIPCQIEGEAIAELLATEFTSVKAWISFQCKDSYNLARGEPFKEAAACCWAITKGSLLAIGMNCINPRNVTSLVQSLNGNREIKLPLVLYPNSGETFDSEDGWKDKDKCQKFDTDMATWLELGCKYIGGCCRTTPDDITNVGQTIMKWKQDRKHCTIRYT